ncbi:MAG TPA: T9SS type A sorting domain-containing protein, partial [Saprospiraceae bacterium]
DPRDPDGWSQLTIESEQDYKTRTISSVFLDQLRPGEQATVECVYIYHQDSTRSHLEQFDVMHANLDMMAEMVLDMDNFCTPFPICAQEDCVWPGDFNQDLIADHRDLLYWGVTNGTTGPQRNGLINWRGHYADDWSKTFPNGTNAKHQDADGYGSIDYQDLQHNISNFSKTTPDYVPHDLYPGGNELAIVSEPMDENGDIGFVRVISQRPLHDIYGISFELDFDTFFYNYSQLIQSYPLDTLGMCYVADDIYPYYSSYTVEQPGKTRYSFVGTHHESFTIPDSFTFVRIPFGLIQKHQIPPEYLPYHIVIRLKNLIGINKEGRELILGADPYIVENPFSTAAGDLEESKIQVYPNPCTDEVMIVCDELSDVELLSIHGKKVRTISANDLYAPVQVADLVPGIYILRFVKAKKIAKLVVQ